MPANEYGSFSGGGALKLKGAKVKKHKRRRIRTPTWRRTWRPASYHPDLSRIEMKGMLRRDGGTRANSQDVGDEEDTMPKIYKTEAERRLEEAKQKKVC